MATFDSLGSSPPGWSETRIWKELESRSARGSSKLRADLASILADVSIVLLHGGTSPLDFTLHDSGHSFRVAEQMADLPGLTELQVLSNSELALLLLSAYLHDIGMTPGRRGVSSHYEYLLSAAPGLLSEEEATALQAWLDERYPGTAPPIARRHPSTPRELRRASELVTHYCRFMHVKWGEAWIKENLGGRELGAYTGWIDDLCRLCASHHEDFDTLSQPSFNPRFVATSGDIVHLRYLACVLRLADIVEFDPERTPAVLLQHREINPQSLVYWWRDKEIAFKADGGRILFTARPTSAHVHRALLELADAIDYELRLCRRLADEHPFDVTVGGVRLPYRWTLPLALHRDIRPRGDEYEYLDGTFRPDTERLLTLLSGTQLYGSPLATIREMLQNAFDAVRECIAYQRLREAQPADERWDGILGSLHQVKLTFRKREDGWWLECTDTGIGMSKDHIRDSLLVSGRAQRPDVLALERRAAEKGVLLNRTGQFGIGVLSYFMLGDHVVFETRRSELAEPRETNGWTFSTDGVRSFGELKPNHACPPGTTVSLHIRDEVLGEEPEAWVEGAISYAASVVVRSPCRLVVTLDDEERYSREPDWTLRHADLIEYVVTSMSMYIYFGETGGEGSDRIPEEAINDLRNRLRFEVEEGFLPEGCGRYRIHLPYFALDRGDSLGWLWLREEASKPALLSQAGSSTHVVLPTVGQIQGWRGIRLKDPIEDMGLVDTSMGWRVAAPYDPELDLRAIVELDWTSGKAGTLAVSRQELHESEIGDAAIRWTYKRALGMARQFATARTASSYSRLNLRLAQVPAPPSSGEKWAVEASSPEGGSFLLNTLVHVVNLLVDRDEIHPLTWVDISLPVVSGIGLPGVKEWKWQGRNVSVLSAVRIRRPGEILGRRTLSFPSWNLAPDLIVATPLGPAPFWNGNEIVTSQADWALNRAAFPPSWNRVAAVRFKNYSGDINDPEIVLNKASWMAHLVTPAAWQWALEVSEAEWSGLPESDERITLQQFFCLMIRCLSRRGSSDWERCMNGQPERFEGLWREIGEVSGHEPPSVVFLKGLFPFWYFEVVSPAGWGSSMVFRPIGTEYLPDPGKEWSVLERDSSSPLARRIGGWLGKQIVRLLRD